MPRGIIYHSIRQDLKMLIKAMFKPLNNVKIIGQFEDGFASYLDCRHCIAFPYARIAIYYSLKLQNFPANSELIMPPITIKAILDVVLDLGLKPIFIDIDPETLCFDLAQLKASVTPNTKAILITYLYGMVPNVESLVSLSKQNNLFILEDFSQCLNGEYKGKKVGGFGDVGIFSSSSIKTLDTYGGGLLVTNNDVLSQKLREHQNSLAPASRRDLIKKIYTNIVRNVATSRLIFHVFVFPLLRIIQYFTPDTWIKNTGDRNKNPINKLPESWFCQYTSVQATLGLELLPAINASDAIRIKNSNYIRANTSIQFPKGTAHTKNVFWQTIAYFSEPRGVLNFLSKKKN